MTDINDMAAYGEVKGVYTDIAFHANSMSVICPSCKGNNTSTLEILLLDDDPNDDGFPMIRTLHSCGKCGDYEVVYNIESVSKHTINYN